MKNSIRDTFIKVYDPILKHFIDSLNGINCENIAEPFIPAWGTEYENCEYKIAFIGMETHKDWGIPEGGLNNWIKYFPLDSELKKNDFLENNNSEINDLTTWEYGSRSIYLQFIKKFLAAFYYLNSNEIITHKTILKSFIYGNTNSFVVPDKAPKGNEAWYEIKKASKIFDRAENIINAFKPKIIVRLYWDDNNDEYFNSYIGYRDSKEIIIEDYLEYYLLDSDTHVYWTRHPVNLRQSKVDFNHIIISIIKSISKKGIFNKFPGERILKSIDEFYLQVEEVGSCLGLIVKIQQFWDSNASIYFSNPNWKFCKIGFEFDDDKGRPFFGGICRADMNITIPSETAITSKLEMIEDSTEYWPYWFWFDEEYKIWNNSLTDETQHDLFIIKLKDHVVRMQKALIALEKEGIEL